MTLSLAERAEILPPENTLVLLPETHYVTETETGLSFRGDTPIEVWGALTERLLAAHRKLEFCLADAINFGDRAYGERYAQWVDEVGLSKRTIANIAYIGRKVDASRRREGVSFSHHAEVAALPPADQEALLDRAIDQGLTRYQLRDAVREHKHRLRAQEPTDGRLPSGGPWRPEIEDLVPEAQKALQKALRATSVDPDAYARGWLDSLQWAGACTAFGDAWKES